MTLINRLYTGQEDQPPPVDKRKIIVIPPPPSFLNFTDKPIKKAFSKSKSVDREVYWKIFFSHGLDKLTYLFISKFWLVEIKMRNCDYLSSFNGVIAHDLLMYVGNIMMLHAMFL